MVVFDSGKAMNVVQGAVSRALRDLAEATLTDAIDRCPVDTGTLRRSGTVTAGNPPNADLIFRSAQAGGNHNGDKAQTGGQVFYVSFNTPYARRQHEGVYDHPRGGEREYLKKAMESIAPKASRYVATKVKEALGGI